MDSMTPFGASSVDAGYPSYLSVRIPATTLTRLWGEVRPSTTAMRVPASTLARTAGEVRLQDGVIGTRHVAGFPKPHSGTRSSRSTPV